jgi:hypothetical protein
MPFNFANVSSPGSHSGIYCYAASSLATHVDEARAVSLLSHESCASILNSGGWVMQTHSCSTILPEEDIYERLFHTLVW